MSAPSTDGSPLLMVLVKSLAAVAAVSASTAVRRAASTACGYGVVAVLSSVSLCFLTFAGYSTLQTTMGSVYASLLVGCAYLFAALIAGLVLQRRRH
jgi:drug/metabolite transporter (DMT)-like permease